MIALAPRLLSVIAPCRNEAAFIDAFCDSVLRQQLPDGWDMEVLIADGLSDDGTRDRLLERWRTEQDARIVAGGEPRPHRLHRAERLHRTRAGRSDCTTGHPQRVHP